MLKVVKAGFFNSIQDKGRVGFASFGVPISGVMDSYSSDLVNGILNNATIDAVLEITLGNSTFQFLEKTDICISGGDFSPRINDKLIPLNKRITVHQNDVLSFGKVKYGVRCYLGVKGGFLSEKKLKSRSFYPKIIKNANLKKNDFLKYKKISHHIITSKSSIKIDRSHFNSKVIECYKGPEFDLLEEHQQKKITSQVFTISKDNSRMGYKLNETIENKLSQILTSAVLPGTVQLTPSGKLIVLMRDCQVTGGYPRVLQLREKSINQLAQKTTNDKFKFVLVL